MRKKKQEPVVINYDYTKWTEDFGFFNLLLARKKGIVKEFLIGTYSKQKSSTDYLTDEEIEPVVLNCVLEVITQISGNYKQFLIDKYFGSLDNMIKFITEDCYVDLITDSIKRNSTKVIKNVQKDVTTKLIKDQVQK